MDFNQGPVKSSATENALAVPSSCIYEKVSNAPGCCFLGIISSHVRADTTWLTQEAYFAPSLVTPSKIKVVRLRKSSLFCNSTGQLPAWHFEHFFEGQIVGFFVCLFGFFVCFKSLSVKWGQHCFICLFFYSMSFLLSTMENWLCLEVSDIIK